MRRLAALLLLALPLAAGCSTDPTERYCEAVEEHQEPLSEIAASDDPAAALRALPHYRDLHGAAPDDIADDWGLVVTRLDALERALSEAGVDPDSYDPERPPLDLGDDERAAIEQAARALGAEETVAAMDAVQQQALDVCGTPLTR